jgi:hypothetical protein
LSYNNFNRGFLARPYLSTVEPWLLTCNNFNHGFLLDLSSRLEPWLEQPKASSEQQCDEAKSRKATSNSSKEENG